MILVDHGSRRDESNRLLHDIAAMFRRETGFEIVEPAHMELASPTIAEAFARCIEQSAELIVIFPYFLLPGRHWDQDIPALAAAAAKNHPGVPYLVTAPLGLHPLMAAIIRQRIDHCLRFCRGEAPACDLCSGTDKCGLRSAASENSSDALNWIGHQG